MTFMIYFALNVHDGSCKDDFLEIRDGPSKQSPVVGKFCGTNMPTSVESTQNIMWIRSKTCTKDMVFHTCMQGILITNAFADSNRDGVGMLELRTTFY